MFLLRLCYFVAVNYSVARQKLKRVEEESDVISNTDVTSNKKMNFVRNQGNIEPLKTFINEQQ